MQAPLNSYEWGTLRNHETGVSVPYRAVEIELDEAPGGRVQVLFGPHGFILPAIVHRPQTLAEASALSQLLAYAVAESTEQPAPTVTPSCETHGQPFPCPGCAFTADDFTADEYSALFDALTGYADDQDDYIHNGWFARDYPKDDREDIVTRFQHLATAATKLGAPNLAEKFEELAATVEELGEHDRDGREA